MDGTPEVPRVLIVDDEEAIRSFAKRVLQAHYDVMIASDGPEALRIVEAQGKAFDLYIIDQSMPEMRGDELARQLRQRDPDVKVLYFTGFSDQLFTRRPVLWAHEAYLDKPVTIKGLQEAVSMLLFGHTRGIEREPKLTSS